MNRAFSASFYLCEFSWALPQAHMKAAVGAIPVSADHAEMIRSYSWGVCLPLLSNRRRDP